MDEHLGERRKRIEKKKDREGKGDRRTRIEKEKDEDREGKG